MTRLIALLPLLLLTAAADEVPFEPSAERFADTAACRARLVELAGTARTGRYDAVEGPYEITPGDVRIHMVRAERNGHAIAEHRCLGGALSARRWTHALEANEPEFTVESVARSAAWLKKGRAEQ
jgi:hypothetical protein